MQGKPHVTLRISRRYRVALLGCAKSLTFAAVAASCSTTLFAEGLQANPFFHRSASVDPPMSLAARAALEKRLYPTRQAVSGRMPTAGGATASPTRWPVQPNQPQRAAVQTRPVLSARPVFSARPVLSAPPVFPATAAVSIRPPVRQELVARTPTPLARTNVTQQATAQQTTTQQIIVQQASVRPSVPAILAAHRTTNWLASGTALSRRTEARAMLDQATSEYGVAAWASAESSGWEAIRLAAEGSDLQMRATGQQTYAIESLSAARDAIRESADFVAGGYASDGVDALARLVRSHRTGVLDWVATAEDSGNAASMTPTDAADQYLNEARKQLSRIALVSLEAAQAMDLLAAIYLVRDDETANPMATSLCLRRAALQGQPTNASLAEQLGKQLTSVGLYREARWALEQSMAIRPTYETSQTLMVALNGMGDASAAQQVALANRRLVPAARPGSLPQVLQLSPAQFAQVSGGSGSAFGRPPLVSPGRSPQWTAPVSNVAPRAVALQASAVPLRVPAQLRAPAPLINVPRVAMRPDSVTHSRVIPTSVSPGAATQPPSPVRRLFDSLGRMW